MAAVLKTRWAVSPAYLFLADTVLCFTRPPFSLGAATAGGEAVAVGLVGDLALLGLFLFTGH